jgi:hypothetical protein
MQGHGMENNWAAEQLHTIRTLMERSALYRRALAPIMIFAGLLGIAASGAGLLLKIRNEAAFIGYWMGVAAVGAAGALLLVRRQALKSGEPFWSPPARHAAQSMLPPLTAGLLLGILAFAVCSQSQVAGPVAGGRPDAGALFWLPAVWAVFYGCGLHGAGFFTLRGLRLLGWLFVAAGNAILFGALLAHLERLPEFTWQTSHYLMGGLFGLTHLAYGAGLRLTEKSDP